MKTSTSPMFPFTLWARNSYPCTLCICRRLKQTDLFPQSGYISKYYENPPADYKSRPPIWKMNSLRGSLRKRKSMSVSLCVGQQPETSFDCSGFVSYVLTNSGLYNTGRLGAQGFTTSQPAFPTRSRGFGFLYGYIRHAGGIHVGIYVGEDGNGSPVMLHCGDPIQYAKLDTSYWQSHFYAYGRLHYN